MDKIYSRHKIRLPQIKNNRENSLKIQKMFFMILMLVISSITSYKILKSIDPIFEGLCKAKAQSIATDITNRKSTDVLARYNYKDTVQMIKTEDGKNSVLKTDIVTINEIASDIAIEIQNELNDISKQTIEIPIGSLTGIKYLAGSGPRIKIKIISAGQIATDIKTEFESAGINQTVYRIYLNLECNVSILTSYKTMEETIQNQVLLVETVIMGDVPTTYLEMEKP